MAAGTGKKKKIRREQPQGMSGRKILHVLVRWTSICLGRRPIMIYIGRWDPILRKRMEWTGYGLLCGHRPPELSL